MYNLLLAIMFCVSVYIIGKVVYELLRAVINDIVDLVFWLTVGKRRAAEAAKRPGDDYVQQDDDK